MLEASMQKLIYTTLAVPGKSELDALLLIESIRSFGGDLSNNPIWVLVPKILGSLSSPTQEKLACLRAKIVPFESDSEILKFPFAAKIVGTAFAEKLARGQTERLAFMDRDTLVLQEPTEFLISADKKLGYRPVHHKLIGPTWDEPLDPFWQLVYEICEVPDDNLFPMTTHAGEQIRPYFNAGMFIVRPQSGLLVQWRDVFLKGYRQPQFQAYYQKNQLYAIFIHQAIFTGILLHNLKVAEMYELSHKVNYPLHLHNDIPDNQRPGTINELVTVRYENIFDEPGWKHLPITEPLKSWLESQPRVQKSFGGQA
jgi:hypothetical protein